MERINTELYLETLVNLRKNERLRMTLHELTEENKALHSQIRERMANNKKNNAKSSGSSSSSSNCESNVTS